MKRDLMQGSSYCSSYLWVVTRHAETCSLKEQLIGHQSIGQKDCCSGLDWALSGTYAGRQVS
jgi:hypothetical protein